MSRTSVFKPQGFTLIELMVVMVILSLLASYVGPNMMRALDRQDVRIEVQQFKSQIEFASIMSFSKEKSVVLELRGKNYRLLADEKTVLEQNTAYLFFTSQDVTFSSTGIPNIPEIEYVIDGKKETINLKPTSRFKK